MRDVTELTRVGLPRDLVDPFEVYVNGVRQQPGADFRRVGDTLVFERELPREGRLGFWRWLSMLLGIAGTYRRDEAVDIVYTSGGKRVVRRAEPVAD